MTQERQWQVEASLLYSLIVAGKSAKFADAKTALLLAYCLKNEMPFEMLRRKSFDHTLNEALRTIKAGNYTKLTKAFEEIAWKELYLETCTPQQLEEIHGIGPKTSRFFIMWIRPNEKYAALDVHVLRWLRSIGVKAPKSTPNGKKYAELEQIFLTEAAKRSKTPRELDLEIWEAGMRKNNVPKAEK
jgi:thermostable 8-oxoguanine DNA glycosylase